MRATARRTQSAGYTHRLEVRQHHLTADEPEDVGGQDEGPSPQELLAASLASCTAITVEMYAARKGWDVGRAEVECTYEQPDHRGATTRFQIVLRLPASLDEEQRERLRTIASKCPVHRTLEGEVSFEDRIETLDSGQSST